MAAADANENHTHDRSTKESSVRTNITVHMTAALVATVLLTATGAHAALTAIVPAYFYPVPNSPWDDLSAAASRIPVTAIMNPGSGPGNFQDSNYVNVVNNLRTAGGKVIGYVSTSWGARSSAVVKADIDKYVNWYNIDGIFFDEMANSGSNSSLNYYQDIYDYVKAINPAWEVMGNPGTTTTESYLTRPAADSLLVFESFASNYPGYTPSGWNFNQDPSAIGHLVHTTASEADMLNYLDLAVQRNAGQVYITDDVLNNPWDTLPSFWDAEVTRIEEINNAPPPAGPQTMSNPVANGSIAVTGNDRTDWAAVPAYNADGADTAGPEVDYRQVQVAHDDNNFYFRFQLDASGFFGFRHNVFIDVDQDRTTGFRGTGDQLSIGAEFLLQGSSVFSFVGASPTTWGWSFLGGQPYDDFPTTDIETQIPRSLIGNPDGFDFVLFGDNSTTDDYYPNTGESGAAGDLLRYLVNGPLAGDLDGDGFVGIADLNVVLGAWNQAVTPGDPLAGDPSGDGFVGIEDLNLVLGNWNAGTPPPGASNIPEPTAVVMMGLGGLAILRRR
jgi:Spherulation-specific family 4